MSTSGDRCPNPKCNGTLRVRTSKRIGDSFEQRLECNRCWRSGGVVVVPGELATILRPARLKSS